MGQPPPCKQNYLSDWRLEELLDPRIYYLDKMAFRSEINMQYINVNKTRYSNLNNPYTFLQMSHYRNLSITFTFKLNTHN